MERDELYEELVWLYKLTRLAINEYESHRKRKAKADILLGALVMMREELSRMVVKHMNDEANSIS